MESVNTTKNFINSQGGIIRSVSLIFYTHEKGFLICDEMRKGYPDVTEKKLQNHLIGGKAELTDITPLYSAVREWCEEVEYADIKKILINLYNCKKIYYDSCVSSRSNMYNRFYVINMDTCIMTFKEEMMNFIEAWYKKPHSVLERVYFWQPGDSLNEPTSLLQIFIKNLPTANVLNLI